MAGEQLGIPDTLSGAATGALPQGNDPGISGQGSLSGGDILAQLLRRIQGGGGSGGDPNGPLTSMGSAPITPTMPHKPEVGNPQIAQGSFRTKGEAKRANKQQIFSSIANITKMGVNAVHQKQVEFMQKNTERLLGAMDGLKEAQASGDQDAIKHNTELINFMLDPSTPEGKKRIKAFQKAFSVNLMDDKNKDTPEYKGLQAAYKQYGQDKANGKATLNPIAQRLQASMPQRAQISPEMQARMEATKAGVLQSADSKATGIREAQNTMANMWMEHQKNVTALKVAQLMGGRDGMKFLEPASPEHPSPTGWNYKVKSKDGMSERWEPVAVPSTLPTEHTGVSHLVMDNPNDPGGPQIIVEVPYQTSTQKVAPGMSGASPISTGGGKTGINGASPISPTVGPVTKQNLADGKHKEYHQSYAQAQEMGLPRGSRVLGDKGLTPHQKEEMDGWRENNSTLISHLKAVDQYTDIYQSMLAGGKVKLAMSPDGKKRIIAGWLPTTPDEQSAAAAWQVMGEYTNIARQSLKAQGFRSLYAWDAMQSLHGQIWQDKNVMHKTINDTINTFDQKNKRIDKWIGPASTDEKKTAEVSPSLKKEGGDNPTPDGTIIQVGDKYQIKKNGKWEDYE